MSYKGENNMFWIPTRIRAELTDQFKTIKNEDQFWRFCDQNIGGFLFYDEPLADESGAIDPEYMKTHNRDIVALNSGGMLYVGAMRFL